MGGVALVPVLEVIIFSFLLIPVAELGYMAFVRATGSGETGQLWVQQKRVVLEAKCFLPFSPFLSSDIFRQKGSLRFSHWQYLLCVFSPMHNASWQKGFSHRPHALDPLYCVFCEALSSGIC